MNDLATQIGALEIGLPAYDDATLERAAAVNPHPSQPGGGCVPATLFRCISDGELEASSELQPQPTTPGYRGCSMPRTIVRCIDRA